MAKSKSITKPATASSEKPVTRPTVTLIAQAIDKYPNANPDPRGNLARLAGDLRKSAEQLQHIYHLTELDDDNPVIAGASYFINIIRKNIENDVEWLEDIAATLHVLGEKGGAE
jgi:hypothetical protein